MTEILSHTAVLDASALLSYLQREPGGEVVDRELNGAVISSVNWSEVLQKALARGVDTSGLGADLAALGLTIEPFTVEDGERAASLWMLTRPLGLSLGDRACIALGLRLNLPILTADRTWIQLAIAVLIRTIR